MFAIAGSKGGGTTADHDGGVQGFGVLSKPCQPFIVGGKATIRSSMKISTIRRSAVLAAAAGLTFGLAAPAFAGNGPSANVPVSAQLGSSIGFATLPGAVNFGAAAVGGDTVVSSPVSIAGNVANYSLTVAPSSGGLSNGSGGTISNAGVYWYPVSVNGMTGSSQGGWQDFAGDIHVFGTDPAGPSSADNASNNGQATIGNSGTMGSTGVGTINAEWALRLPINQAAGSYSETFTYSLSGS